MEFLNVRTMERSKGLQPSDPMPQTENPLDSSQDQGYNTSQYSDISVPENVILQTKNYGMFKIDPLNREIRQDKLDHLYNAIQAKNLLHLFPIVVTRSFVIIDGQHRFKVAESLDTPIYYIVSSQMRIEDAAWVNTNVHTWKGVDYLNHWVRVGLPDYVLVRDFWAANPFLTFSTTIKLLAFGGQMYREKHASLTQTFYLGQFHVTDLAFATRVLNMAHDFSRWIRFWKDSSFLSAILNLAANPDYNHARMMMKMDYLSTRLVRCPDVKSYFQVIEAIYNHKASDGRRVQFRLVNASRIAKQNDLEQE